MALKEYVNSVSPSTAGFAFTGGRAVMQFIEDTPANLEADIVELLGNCERGSDGKLYRTLPKAHPRFPWLYASNISNIVGWKPTTKDAASSTLEAAPLPYFQNYEKYLLTIEFTPRNYAVVTNEKIPAYEITWTDEDGSTVTSKAANEHWRFIEYEVKPSAELLTATQGSMEFSTQAGSAPSGTPFVGRPRITVGKKIIIVTWNQVPLSYVTSINSYFARFAGRVNQTEFFGAPPGTLLFNGIDAPSPTPPAVPSLVQWDGTNIFSVEKFVNVKMNFEYTTRRATDPPNSVANDNWIAQGWNSVPYFATKQFYYVQNKDAVTAANRWPMFSSAPFVLLFSDPDV